MKKEEEKDKVKKKEEKVGEEKVEAKEGESEEKKVGVDEEKKIDVERGKKNEKGKREEPKKKIGKIRGEITGILHIYSSKNNTILHVTDITGAETLSIKTGGQMVKSQREESSPYAAMQAMKGVVKEIEDKGIKKLWVKIRAPGGYSGPFWTGKGAQAALKAISRSGIKIEGVENVTPLPHGHGCRPRGGRRGRRV